MLMIFLKGLIIGLGASIPLGPLGILCIQKTLSRGRFAGFVTGLGASVSDTFYSTISLLGLVFIEDLIDSHKPAVLMVGGIVILIIGLKIYVTNPIRQIRQKNKKSKHVEDFFEALAMTITNPGSIFLILAMFTAVRFNVADPAIEPRIIILTVLWGVFTGSALWWFTLSTSISTFRKKFRLKQLIMLNKISGVIIAAIGTISFCDGIFEMIVLRKF
ncbi:MAG: LysE family transporter [Bacteroidales bacterium]|nr:LysE family transporter [Bacteroidales bacterium]